MFMDPMFNRFRISCKRQYGMQGGTAATQTCFIEHVGIPTLAALRQAVDALEDMNMKGTVQLIISGGIRTGGGRCEGLSDGGRCGINWSRCAYGIGLQ